MQWNQIRVATLQPSNMEMCIELITVCKKLELNSPQPDLLIPHVLCTSGGRLLHGCQTQHLQQVVLHHITDDPKLIKIATTPLSPKWLLEGDGYSGDAVAIPDRLEHGVCKPGQGEQRQSTFRTTTTEHMLTTTFFCENRRDQVNNQH